MHHCLYVDEIIRLIARKLVVANNHATAVALARCCKCFEDPVLDVLWEVQCRFDPLLEILPGDIKNPNECDVSVLITFTEPASPH